MDQTRVQTMNRVFSDAAALDQRNLAVRREAQAVEEERQKAVLEHARRLREIERQAELQKQGQNEPEEWAEKRKREAAAQDIEVVQRLEKTVAAQQRTIEELQKQLEQAKSAPKQASNWTAHATRRTGAAVGRLEGKDC